MKTAIPSKFIKMHFWLIVFSGFEFRKSSYKFTRNGFFATAKLPVSTIQILCNDTNGRGENL